MFITGRRLPGDNLSLRDRLALYVEGEDDPDTSGQSAGAGGGQDDAGTGDGGDASDTGDGDGKKFTFKSHEEAETGYSELRTMTSRQLEELRRDKQRLEEDLAAAKGTTGKTAEEPDTDPDEVMAQQVSAAAHAEVSKISRTDPEYTAKVYNILFKHMLKAGKTVAGSVAKTTVSSEKQHETNRQKSEGRMVEELKKLNLDESFLDEAHREVDYIFTREPEFFAGIPKDQHFSAVAKRVAERIEKIREGTKAVLDAQREHRETAGGVIDGGARANAGGGSKGKEPKDDQPDSMTAQIRAFQGSRRAVGKLKYDSVHAS